MYIYIHIGTRLQICMVVRFWILCLMGQEFYIRIEVFQANFNPSLFSHQNSRHLKTLSHYNSSGYLFTFGKSILHWWLLWCFIFQSKSQCEYDAIVLLSTSYGVNIDIVRYIIYVSFSSKYPFLLKNVDRFRRNFKCN